MAPDGDLPSGVKQVLKPTDPQTLFAQSPVKAFDVRVLRGLTGLDVYKLDLLLNAPGQEMTAGQIGVIVTSNGPRSPRRSTTIRRKPRGPTTSAETAS